MRWDSTQSKVWYPDGCMGSILCSVVQDVLAHVVWILAHCIDHSLAILVLLTQSTSIMSDLTFYIHLSNVFIFLVQIGLNVISSASRALVYLSLYLKQLLSLGADMFALL